MPDPGSSVWVKLPQRPLPGDGTGNLTCVEWRHLNQTYKTKIRIRKEQGKPGHYEGGGPASNIDKALAAADKLVLASQTREGPPTQPNEKKKKATHADMAQPKMGMQPTMAMGTQMAQPMMGMQPTMHTQPASIGLPLQQLPLMNQLGEWQRWMQCDALQTMRTQDMILGALYMQRHHLLQPEQQSSSSSSTPPQQPYPFWPPPPPGIQGPDKADSATSDDSSSSSDTTGQEEDDEKTGQVEVDEKANEPNQQRKQQPPLAPTKPRRLVRKRRPAGDASGPRYVDRKPRAGVREVHVCSVSLDQLGIDGKLIHSFTDDEVAKVIKSKMASEIPTLEADMFVDCRRFANYKRHKWHTGEHANIIDGVVRDAQFVEWLNDVRVLFEKIMATTRKKRITIACICQASCQ